MIKRVFLFFTGDLSKRFQTAFELIIMDHQNQSKGKSSFETANDPTGEQVFHALQWLFKYSSNEEIVITGDKYEFPELRNEKFGVKLIEAEVVDMPSYDDREEDEDDFETRNDILCLLVLL